LTVLLSHTALAVEFPDVGATIGVNKYDLFAQYTGTASGGDGGPAYRRVTRAMAKKAIADAADIGVRYMRVSMSGRTSRKPGDGRDSLDLWRNEPQAFWSQVDEMMDDLDAHGMRIVPVLAWGSGKFPTMAREPLGEMFRNPDSASWRLQAHFVTEFVSRYRSRPTVLFYELTNELNNYADLDMQKRCDDKKQTCEAGDRFTTEDMVAYTRRFAALIRKLDPSRPISSGFSISRPSAEHLRAAPEWKTGRADWRPDSPEQFARNLEEIHDGVDILSIHLYGGKKNWRFGSSDAVDLLVEAKRVADRIGKPLFVGEFGDSDPALADERSHTVRMMNKLVELKVPYSALWVWEFYQDSPYETHNNRHTSLSLEPGYTDVLIARLRAINQRGAGLAQPRAEDTQPPRVVLTWPLDCAKPTGPMILHAVASDESGGVAKVEFLVGRKVVAVDDTPPYQTTLPADRLKPGRHHLTARAYDSAGNMAGFSSMVLVGDAVECSPRAR
jgi:hypothetical protein